jgi:hypothetical protein
MNVVINNANHLKEFLINFGLPVNDFNTLLDIFKTNHFPMAIIQKIELKGIVISERMRKRI